MPDAVAVGQVERRDGRIAAGLMDLLFDFFEIVGAARGDDDMGAFLRQGEGGCRADTAACTRNERQLTFKLHS